MILLLGLVACMHAKNILKVYVGPTILKNVDYKHMEEVLKSLVEGEVEVD
jgi:hypothetical protein